jgi:hypothetical protein
MAAPRSAVRVESAAVGSTAAAKLRRCDRHEHDHRWLVFHSSTEGASWMSVAIRKNTCAAQVYWERDVRNRQRDQGIATSLFRERTPFLDGVVGIIHRSNPQVSESGAATTRSYSFLATSSRGSSVHGHFSRPIWPNFASISGRFLWTLSYRTWHDSSNPLPLVSQSPSTVPARSKRESPDGSSPKSTGASGGRGEQALSRMLRRIPETPSRAG